MFSLPYVPIQPIDYGQGPTIPANAEMISGSEHTASGRLMFNIIGAMA